VLLHQSSLDIHPTDLTLSIYKIYFAVECREAGANPHNPKIFRPII
jgi:hypothetical protein